MDNKTQTQLVKMDTKTIGPRKLQLFIVERTERERNIPISKRATKDTYSDESNKILHNKETDKGRKIIDLNSTLMTSS